MADQPRPAIVRQQQQSGGLFGNADHTVIYGGSFTSVGGTKSMRFLFKRLKGTDYTFTSRKEWFSDFAGARCSACISQLEATPRSPALSREHTPGRAAGAIRMDCGERRPHGMDCVAEWRCWSREICDMPVHRGDVHCARHLGG